MCKNKNCQSGVINGVNPRLCKKCNFICDSCGNTKPNTEKFQMVDENYNLLKGLFECASCRGLK